MIKRARNKRANKPKACATIREPMTDAAALLDADGPLARTIPGFAPRTEQRILAEAVENALSDGSVLIGEAGTGVGKTFAYLVPVLARGGRTIISTGTRHLQDQLFHSDLPRVQRALGSSVRVALLKGRSNYLCLQRMGLADGAGITRRPEIAAELERVRAAAAVTTTGDVAEIADVAEDSPLWPWVTSTTDNCLGQDCPFYRDCFVVKARKQAQEADVVVVNHHLLFADLTLKESGFGEVLPSADAFIVDEAHQLPETAANFFGQRLSSRQLQELVRDVQAQQLQEAPDADHLRSAATAVDTAARDFRLALGREPQRASWHTVAGDPAVDDALAALHTAVEALAGELTPQAERGRGLETCQRRAETLAQALGAYGEPTDDNEGAQVAWFETYRQGFALARTPLDIASTFARLLDSWPASWVFTSATLAVGGRFDHFRDRLGLADAREVRVESPFDYARNALLYVPADLPDPRSGQHTDAVVARARPVLAASGGRAFILFTSYRALHHAAEQFRGNLDYPLFVQGEAPKQELVERFRATGNGVLLGTASFWEGVDVAGEALSCVIIDKLPFASPADPVVRARLDAIEQQGGNAFVDYQIPQAAIALKQGAGRLIRGVADCGVLMLCDPRLRQRGYGRIFLDSLPPMPRTTTLGDVEAFFARMAVTEAER